MGPTAALSHSLGNLCIGGVSSGLPFLDALGSEYVRFPWFVDGFESVLGQVLGLTEELFHKNYIGG